MPRPRSEASPAPHQAGPGASVPPGDTNRQGPRSTRSPSRDIAKPSPCPLVLAVATAKEYRAAFGALGAPAAPDAGDAVAWRHGGRDLLVCITGVGPVATALRLGRLLGRLEGRIAGIVNTGIAGSYDLKAAPLRSVVAATTEIFPEYGLRGDTDTQVGDLAFAQATVAGQPVFDRLPLDPAAAAQALRLRLPPGTATGACVTVAGVSATPGRAAVLAATYAPLAESMEGFAAALAAATAGVPFVELRTVSNRVGARPPEDWDLPGALAALGRAMAGLFS